MLEQLKLDLVAVEKKIKRRSQSHLTPLGEQTLLTSEEREKKTADIAALEQKRRALALRVQRQEDTLQEQSKGFQGEIRARR